MAYSVEILPSALADLEDALRWWKEQVPEQAEKWLTGLLEEVAELETLPGRCPVAREESEALGCEIRKRIYRKGSQAYLIYFRIADAETVRILRIRHASRDRISPDALLE